MSASARAMQHMHVLYCHEKSSTLRIESLTPEADIAEAEAKARACVMMYHHPTGLVKPVQVTELVKNRTPYSRAEVGVLRRGSGLVLAQPPTCRAK